ncbi:hypothetical protein SAMN05421841_2604 [Chryseobacterium wanjuense]|uniref:SnoaL-like domain-containing protein n=1 Tax=Chryseobacterium wanjuense TaxID=356305 RepID=A0A1I0RFA7_9FLAO|nr:nuclear transport factor 2 family protein [Chryseobacterium wanjuense]SEW39512.1 hypothetical protein SAMN05421841_2604 [Chryseobacterium wanjuense]
MNLPIVLKNLLEAQKKSDSLLYSECFTDDAVVFDEGKTHKGKDKIRQWNEKSTEEYQFQMEPLEFSQEDKNSILKANVSGNFAGSPIVLTYTFQIENDKISSLKISG